MYSVYAPDLYTEPGKLYIKLIFNKSFHVREAIVLHYLYAKLTVSYSSETAYITGKYQLTTGTRK